MPSAKHPYLTENFWLDRFKFEDGERQYHELAALLTTINKDEMETILNRFDKLEEEQQSIKGSIGKLTSDLASQLKDLTATLNKLKVSGIASAGGDAKPAPAAAAADDDDDDVDLFGDSESEDEDAKRLKEERLAKYAEKKAKKPGVIAKSNVILDVKPWDDETDMKELEVAVRSIVQDGLLWGTSKLVEVGFGIKKLQISTVVEDDKVSIDELTEKIQEFEDFVQSVDIAAFNKI